MIKTLIFLLMFLNILTSAKQLSPDLSINHDILGLYTFKFDTNNFQPSFDIAGNSTLMYNLSNQLDFTAQVQMGPGGGPLALAGPSLSVSDFYIHYNYQPNTSLFMGSFDLPFGLETPFLTNNANSSHQVFMCNNLFYSALSRSPFGTLNTVGVMLNHRIKQSTITAMLSNGTGESSENLNNSPAILLSYSQHMFAKKLESSVSFLHSADDQDTDGTSFESNVAGFLLDASYFFDNTYFFRAHLGVLNFDDNENTTSDDVWFYGLSTEFNYDFIKLGVRLSTWLPTDSSGDGENISSELPNPGLGNVFNDDTITRLQLSLEKPLENQLILSAEYVYDVYKHAGNHPRFITAIGFGF